jgi:hypothetical protein
MWPRCFLAISPLYMEVLGIIIVLRPYRSNGPPNLLCIIDGELCARNLIPPSVVFVGVCVVWFTHVDVAPGSVVSPTLEHVGGEVADLPHMSCKRLMGVEGESARYYTT